ncbi:hypothetical protein GCM10009582_29110 [Arthrobacter flavus]
MRSSLEDLILEPGQHLGREEQGFVGDDLGLPDRDHPHSQGLEGFREVQGQGQAVTQQPVGGPPGKIQQGCEFLGGEREPEPCADTLPGRGAGGGEALHFPVQISDQLGLPGGHPGQQPIRGQ